MKKRAARRRAEEDAFEHAALTADCSTLMKTPRFGSIVTLLMQLLTLIVIGLLSIVTSLLKTDSTAISYLAATSLILTLLVYELGITRWNMNYGGTFRLILFWNLWLLASILFKLYANVEIFGRVMAVLVSVAATVLAVLGQLIPSFASLFSFLTVLLLLFPLNSVGLFDDSIILLIVRIILYMLLCIIVERLLYSRNDHPQHDVLVSISCFWILLALPHFWIATILILLISWYKGRKHELAVTKDIDVSKNEQQNIPEIKVDKVEAPTLQQQIQPQQTVYPIPYQQATPYPPQSYQPSMPYSPYIHNSDSDLTSYPYNHNSNNDNIRYSDDVGGNDIDLSVLNNFFGK